MGYFAKQAAKEVWNPGLTDIEAFYAIDPQGFFIGYLDQKPIACISNAKYDDTFSFFSFYIVDQAYRGQGYGMKIWQHAIEYACDASIGLDGVVLQVENYRKSGFKEAYKNSRYQYRANDSQG